jgi:peptidoglycan/xylan/chitin deacetylase (PgdA/CDA1 family)
MPRMTWGFFGETKKVFLTFDDGPTPDVTDRALEELKKFDAKATFFCLGRNVDHNPEIYKRILQGGHSVGNHSYSHLRGYGTKNQQYFDDIELAGRLIDSDLFRPPYGRILHNQVTEIIKKYKIIMWDVLSYDYNRRVKGETIIRNVKKYTRSGSIIVFHDSAKARKNLYYALPRVLDDLYNEGYEMLAIPMKREDADRLEIKKQNGI